MNFFITRPIFASAIALIIILAGGVSMLTLPIAQFPPLVPPQVAVSAQYIGAGAEVVENSVTIPLEEQLNGAEGMIYMSSQSTNNGNSIITVTFDPDYDQNIAQMELLSSTNQALSQMPQEVQQVGVSVEKSSSGLLLAVNLISPNGTYDGRFLQNYAEIHVLDPLARIPGVAEVAELRVQRVCDADLARSGQARQSRHDRHGRRGCGQRAEPAGGHRCARAAAGARRAGVHLPAQHPGPPRAGRAVRGYRHTRAAQRLGRTHQGRRPGSSSAPPTTAGRPRRATSPPATSGSSSSPTPTAWRSRRRSRRR